MNLELLLNNIYAINKRFEELTFQSGANFNIFNILDVSVCELSHSAFLSELLSPNGSHGKGSIFLKKFLNIICPGMDLEAEGAKVSCEKSVENGRIDILIEAKNFALVIENKIYANDQDKQLKRYYDYLNKEFSKKLRKLAYLTLDGRNASKESLDSLEEDEYIRLSYRGDILEWLNECYKETADMPFLRETLAQYIVLIKNLTGQSERNKMSDEILKVLTKSKENIAAAFDVEKYLAMAKTCLVRERLIPALKYFANKEGFEFFSDSFDTPFKKYLGFTFYNKSWNFLKIRFEFQSENFKEFIYGFQFTNNTSPESLKAFFSEQNSYKHSASWPIYRHMDLPKYRIWDKDTFVSIAEGGADIVNAMQEKINELVKLLDGKEM